MNKTILAIGVIALFIGVGIQPAISNEVTIPKISDDKEDYIECQSDGKTNLAEKLLNKLEKNEVISNVIDFDTQEDDRPICILLNNTYQRCVDLLHYYYYLKDILPEDSIFLRIVQFCTSMSVVVAMLTLNLLIDLNCWEL